MPTFSPALQKRLEDVFSTWSEGAVVSVDLNPEDETGGIMVRSAAFVYPVRDGIGWVEPHVVEICEWPAPSPGYHEVRGRIRSLTETQVVIEDRRRGGLPWFIERNRGLDRILKLLPKILEERKETWEESREAFRSVAQPWTKERSRRSPSETEA